MQNTSNTQLLTRPVNTNVDTGNFSTPMISVSDKKRKDTEAVNGPIVAKKPRGRPPGRKNQVQGIIFCESIKYILSFHNVINCIFTLSLFSQVKTQCCHQVIPSIIK